MHECSGYRRLSQSASRLLTGDREAQGGRGRALHRHSTEGKPFIALNMAAIPRDLLESELLHERAFTGPACARRFEQAEAAHCS